MKTTKQAISILGVVLFTFLSFAAFSQNDEITKQDRTVGEFKSVKVSMGIELYLTQSDKSSVCVETYADKQEKVITEVKDGFLKIYIDGRYNRSKSPKVYVSNAIFEQICGSSGSSVNCETEIKGDKMYLDFGSASELKGKFSAKEFNCDAGSGAQLTIEVAAGELFIESSSGAQININGSTETLLINASSGAEINAYELASQKCTVETSSGSEIEINVEKEIHGSASSGSEISYKGTASTETFNVSSGAEIHKR